MPVFQSTCPRGARPWKKSTSCLGVFQSTCPRGARQDNSNIRSPQEFQSTCPRGARHSDETGVVTVGIDISIHVPTGGTTLYKLHPCNPPTFQSTCPRGARRVNVMGDVTLHDFNPRAHGGHDATGSSSVSSSSISIHVPTGGTTLLYRDHVKTWISIHVPTGGTTQYSVD